MVIPNFFDKYRDLVSSCLDLKEKADQAAFGNLIERNTHVQRPRHHLRPLQCTPQQRVIRLLDSKRLAHDVSAISAACLNAVEDRAVLVRCVLEWTASPFRSGICRVYTSARLLRKWKMSGIDVDSYILSFLTGTQRYCALNLNNIYHTISELVRSRTFSVGKYLQWLMAKGVDDCLQTGQKRVKPYHDSLKPPF